MAIDAGAVERVRAALAGVGAVSERRMMGALCFMVGDAMCCGVTGSDLMLRLGPAGAAEAVKDPHVRPMVTKRRVAKAFVFVSPEGYADDAALERWLAQARAFVATLG